MGQSEPAQKTHQTDCGRGHQADRKQPDANALIVAQAVHREITPLATILFGSSARGNHREDSDIDILIINRTAATGRQEGQAKEYAEAAATRIYAEHPKIQLVFITLREFRMDAAYINSISTQAILDGSLLTDHPEQFRSPYSPHSSGEQPTPAYDWSDYGSNLRSATRQMAFVRATADPTLVSKLPQSIGENLPKRAEQINAQERRESISVLTPIIIDNLLRAAISATGQIPRKDATAQELYEHLQRLMPNEDLTTELTVGTYQNLRDNPPDDYITFVQTLDKDTRKLRNLAMRTKKRTAATADPAVLQPGEIMRRKERGKHKDYLTNLTVLPLGTRKPDMSGQPVLRDYLPKRMKDRDPDELIMEMVTKKEGTKDAKQYWEAHNRLSEDIARYRDKIIREMGATTSQWYVVSGGNFVVKPPEPVLLIRNIRHKGRSVHTTEQLQQLTSRPDNMNSITGWKESPPVQREALMTVIKEHLEFALSCIAESQEPPTDATRP